MANGTSDWAQPAGWIGIFITGVAAIFGLGKMKQQVDQHGEALKLQVTQETFAGLMAQVESLHEDVREIRQFLFDGKAT